MAARPLPSWVGPVARFGIVGGLAAGLDYSILKLLVWQGVSPYYGRFVSVPISMVFTWVLNRTVTFQAAAPPSWREFGHYVAVALGGMALNLAIYSSLLWLGLPLTVAFVIATGLTAVYSFLRYRRVFKAG